MFEPPKESDLLNIDPKKIDPNDRYKMHPIQIRIEGRGNGIKTILLNVKTIGKELHRSSEEVLKFLGHVRGAVTTFFEHEEKHVIHGSFTKDVIQNDIYQYIETYVLCRQCRLPETVYHRKGKRLITVCSACAHQEEVIDKLKSFILKGQLPTLEKES